MISEITTIAELRAITQEWTALFERCPDATPFQSPEWLLPWWDAFQPGELFCLAQRHDGRLMGLMPLYVDEAGVARFLGAGISDHHDALLEPGMDAAPLIAHLETSGCLRECHLLELPGCSPLLRVRQATGTSAVRPVLRLPAQPGYDLRRNLRRYGQKLAAAHAIEYGLDAGERRGEYLDALFSLHEARWNGKGEPGVLADPQLRRFHDQAAAGFAGQKWLRFFGLRADGSLIAVIYAFALRGRAYFYLNGFAPHFARYSPGILLLNFALQEFASAGIVTADFLRGGESYKYVWGAEDAINYELRLHSSGTRSAKEDNAAQSSGAASDRNQRAWGNAAGRAAPGTLSR